MQGGGGEAGAFARKGLRKRFTSSAWRAVFRGFPMKNTLCFVVLWLCASPVFAGYDPVISEFMASNKHSIANEDEDH